MVVIVSELRNINFSSNFIVVYVLLLFHRVIGRLIYEMTKLMYEIRICSVKQ
jgi:hypothetical protein